MENNLDKEKIFLDNMGNRMKLAKENGCKLLDCKTIDNNIKLRLENIKLKSELETYKKIVDEKNKELNEENLECSKLAVENNDLKEKLKTSEKIAEKLADKLVGKTTIPDLYSDAVLGCEISKEENEKCSKYNKGATCKQCIIDWARNEVESENKNKK